MLHRVFHALVLQCIVNFLAYLIKRENFFAHDFVNVMSAIVADHLRNIAYFQIEHRSMRRRLIAGRRLVAWAATSSMRWGEPRWEYVG